MVKLKNRKAIAMIELIFALVIMGIVLMSAPTLISTSTKSNFVAFQQESIAILASHTNALMSYAWDNNNVPIVSNNVILTANGDVNLSASAANPQLRGVTTRTQRQRIFLGGLAAGAIAHEEGAGGVFNDVDDFNGTNTGLRLFTAANAANVGEYIDQTVNINTQVNYNNDTPAGNTYISGNALTFNFPANVAGTTNIKHIQTTLTSLSADADIRNKNIVMHAFMCNIGATRPITKGNL